MYTLIKGRLASMWELKNVYTLDEALKLYALWDMERDIHEQQDYEMAEEMRKEG